MQSLDWFRVQGYLLRVYLNLVFFALFRARPTWEDMNSFLFMIKAPLLYIMGTTGLINTPTGKIQFEERGMLRAYAYGFIKTHFAYCRTLERLWPATQYFPVVVDVGANLGDFSLALAPKSGKVVSIEPDARNFGTLSDNVRLNRMDQVQLVMAAAHSYATIVYLEGNQSDMYVVTKNNGLPVEAKSLDQIAKELDLERISLMKIDVQGDEMEALAGLRHLLQTHAIDLLIIEVHLRRKVSCEDVRSFVEQNGYRLVYTDPYLPHQPHLYFAPIHSLQIAQPFPLPNTLLIAQ